MSLALASLTAQAMKFCDTHLQIKCLVWHTRIEIKKYLLRPHAVLKHCIESAAAASSAASSMRRGFSHCIT